MFERGVEKTAVRPTIEGRQTSIPDMRVAWQYTWKDDEVVVFRGLSVRPQPEDILISLSLC